MRVSTILRLAAILTALAACPATAQDSQGRYSVRALGVKVGEFAISGRVTERRYAVRSTFTTTDLAGAVAGVKFLLSAEGDRQGAAFRPARYDEEMDTGERDSRARLRYSGGVARASGSQIRDRGEYAVTDAQQRGAVDPLTAMFMVLRDQERERLCQLRQRIYDGERLTEITLSPGPANAEQVTCQGIFRRIAGYAPEDLNRKKDFGLTVVYVPAGDAMRAMRMTADTLYGPATMIRR
ncbi:MAG: DUF3108 domain-containing protein [Pseudomonadota bacterium]